MKTRESNEIPEFKSLDEEREYWEARGALAEGHKGRVNKPTSGQKRSSFLAIRLTGEELTRLRDIAAEQGLGPSTFARLVLTSVVENRGKLPKRFTLEQLKDYVEENLSPSVKDKAETIFNAGVIGNPTNPNLLLLYPPQIRELEELGWEVFRLLLAKGNVELITPEDKRYEGLRDVINTQT